MRIIKVLVSSFVILFLTACEGDDDSNNDNVSVEKDQNTTETSESDTNSNTEVLNLGETGTMDNTLGTYEVTPESIQIVEAPEGIANNRDMFLIVELTITNLGDTDLNGSDVANADLFDDNGSVANNQTHLEFANFITEEIKPGESVKGELLFDVRESNSYELIFGFGRSTVSNELTWKFTNEEIN